MSWEGVGDLIERAKGGDDHAWRALHEMVRPYLLKLAQRTLGPAWPEQSASDLTQDTWERVVRGIGEFRGGPDDGQTAAVLRAWLRRIMNHAHANRIRSARTRRRKAPAPLVSLDALGRSDLTDGASPLELVSGESTPSANARREESRLAVREVLEGLPDPRDRELLLSYFFEGCTLSQIAQRQGVSVEEVRSRRQDILKRLGRELKDLR
jgi:RNA polymerase sigma factor (sigma-70 family)